MKAAIRNQGNGLWSVVVDGRTVIIDESYTVASNIQFAINNPTLAPPSEAAEIADGIRKAATDVR